MLWSGLEKATMCMLAQKMSPSAVLFEKLFQGDQTFSPVSLLKLCFFFNLYQPPRKILGPLAAYCSIFLFQQSTFSNVFNGSRGNKQAAKMGIFTVDVCVCLNNRRVSGHENLHAESHPLLDHISFGQFNQTRTCLGCGQKEKSSRLCDDGKKKRS